MSISTVLPIYTDFGIETKYNVKILKEMLAFYAKYSNQ